MLIRYKKTYYLSNSNDVLVIFDSMSEFNLLIDRSFNALSTAVVNTTLSNSRRLLLSLLKD